MLKILVELEFTGCLTNMAWGQSAIYILSCRDIIGIHERMIATYRSLAINDDSEYVNTNSEWLHVWRWRWFMSSNCWLYSSHSAAHCFKGANNRTAFASSVLFLQHIEILVRFRVVYLAEQGRLNMWNIAGALKQPAW